MGGNDTRFLAWVFLRAAPGLAWRIALYYWPVSLAIGAVLIWGVFQCFR
jgi:Flp pilus assembly protein protease CpaA